LPQISSSSSQALEEWEQCAEKTKKNYLFEKTIKMNVNTKTLVTLADSLTMKHPQKLSNHSMKKPQISTEYFGKALHGVQGL